ncbi:MAG: Lrp/AsnC family transcriptional regulator [Clostridia bacterium]|nr:Lrp/AsnC family transcriptional regulator [Clostridia bacterium]
MEQIEKDILAILESDSRITADRMAAMLGVDKRQVEERVKQLEEKGAIVKYATIVNSDEIDETLVEALIEVKVTPQKGAGFDAIAREIAEHDEVKNLYLMSGAYDLAVIVEGKSLKSISRFVSERISTYDSVLSTATHFILKKYKVEGALITKGADRARLSIQP